MSVEFVSAAQAAQGVACEAPLRLVDTFGRVARDLRVSLTDRCNLRCSYCMPPEGLDWLPTEDTLTDQEVVRLVGIGVEKLGIRQVRFTGGEPLLRRGLEGIIGECSELRTDEGKKPDLALTTNALGLAKRAQGLRDAGLDRVNISLDSLDAEHYAAITRRDRLGDVLEGIEAAARAGLTPIKVNTLVLRGMNEADLPDLVDYCLDRGIELRVIEQMPIGPPDTWDPAHHGHPPHADPRAARGPAFPGGSVDCGRRSDQEARSYRLSVRPLLRSVRPHPPDLGRNGAILPVFHGGDLAAGSAARGWFRCADCRAMGRRDVGEAGRARPQHRRFRAPVAHDESYWWVTPR